MKPIPQDSVGAVGRRGSYRITEVFDSVQGEGLLAGTPMVFVRFSRCNLRCAVGNSAGFDCDTDFQSGAELTAGEILARVDGALGGRRPGAWVLLTGGEPLLQVDEKLATFLVSAGYRLALETNGTIKLGELRSHFSHVTVSPHTAWHTIRERTPDEVRLVRHANVALPAREDEPWKTDPARFVSPAFAPSGELEPGALRWCVWLVKEHRDWRLSVQSHKLLGVR
jgi:organic radical activating enzyme